MTINKIKARYNELAEIVDGENWTLSNKLKKMHMLLLIDLIDAIRTDKTKAGAEDNINRAMLDVYK